MKMQDYLGSRKDKRRKRPIQTHGGRAYEKGRFGRQKILGESKLDVEVLGKNIKRRVDITLERKNLAKKWGKFLGLKDEKLVIKAINFFEQKFGVPIDNIDISKEEISPDFVLNEQSSTHLEMGRQKEDLYCFNPNINILNKLPIKSQEDSYQNGSFAKTSPGEKLADYIERYYFNNNNELYKSFKFFIVKSDYQKLKDDWGKGKTVHDINITIYRSPNFETIIKERKRQRKLDELNKLSDLELEYAA